MGVVRIISSYLAMTASKWGKMIDLSKRTHLQTEIRDIIELSELIHCNNNKGAERFQTQCLKHHSQYEKIKEGSFIENSLPIVNNTSLLSYFGHII
jgi:hypothetical protein